MLLDYAAKVCVVPLILVLRSSFCEKRSKQPEESMERDSLVLRSCSCEKRSKQPEEKEREGTVIRYCFREKRSKQRDEGGAGQGRNKNIHRDRTSKKDGRTNGWPMTLCPPPPFGMTVDVRSSKEAGVLRGGWVLHVPMLFTSDEDEDKDWRGTSSTLSVWV